MPTILSKIYIKINISNISFQFDQLTDPIAQKFGFKNSLIIYGIPSTFGWILIFFAKSVTMILVGRLITGFCSGLICGIAPGYVNDISTVNVRGLLGSLFEVRFIQLYLKHFNLIK